MDTPQPGLLQPRTPCANASQSDPSSRLQRGERRQTGVETETGMSRQGGLRCVPHHPSLPLPTCQRWPRRQHCARCSGARGARWLRGSRLSRLWSGGRRRRLGAHSTLGRRKQPRPQVRATGSSVGSGIGNVTSPVLKREEETAQEPPLLE